MPLTIGWIASLAAHVKVLSTPFTYIVMTSCRVEIARLAALTKRLPVTNWRYCAENIFGNVLARFARYAGIKTLMTGIGCAPKPELALKFVVSSRRPVPLRR